MTDSQPITADGIATTTPPMPDVPIPTPFATMPDEHLLQMLFAGTPERVRAVGDRWGVVSRSMRRLGDDIAGDYTPVRQTWTGPSADKYEEQIGGIVDAAEAIGDMAGILQDLIFSAADSLKAAQDLFTPPEPPPDDPNSPPSTTSA